MENAFGPITPIALIALVTGITQFVKKFLPEDVPPRYVQLVALGFSVLAFVPFHLLQSSAVNGWEIYQSIVYTAVAWLSATGAYEAVKGG